MLVFGFPSGRIGQRLAGEPVALVQDVIDVETRLDAIARRASGTQGHFEFHLRRFLASGQRTHQAFGLTRQIVEGGLQGFEPAQEVCRIFQTIGIVTNWRGFAAP